MNNAYKFDHVFTVCRTPGLPISEGSNASHQHVFVGSVVVHGSGLPGQPYRTNRTKKRRRVDEDIVQSIRLL